MRFSRRIAAILSGLLLLGAVASGPALATDPSDGYCDPSEAGEIAIGNDGWLYECVKNPGGGGYIWTPY
jgi:hypothetical protein